MKYCEKCGKQLNDDAVFCEGCGVRLINKADEEKQVFTCKNCGAEHTSIPLFCEKCGVRIRKEDVAEAITVSEDIQVYEFKTKLMNMPKDKFLKTMAIITLSAIAVFVGAFFAINAILYSNYELNIGHHNMIVTCSYIGKERTHTFCEKVWGGVVCGARADDNDIIRKVEIPASVNGSVWFVDCDNLEDVVILGDGMGLLFSGCKSLKTINIPENSYIMSRGFECCESLESIKIPLGNGYTLADNAFSGCTGLTSVEIPDGLTSIGYNAFYGCTSLTCINIPNSVEIIRSGAFIDCPLLDVEIPYGCEVEEEAFKRKEVWFW